MNGSSKAAALIRNREWSSHPLGSPETWPVGLRLVLDTILNSPEPMCLAWGSELTFFFNDAYMPIPASSILHWSTWR